MRVYRSWKLLNVWQLLTTVGNFWQLAIFDNFWQFLAIFGNIWPHVQSNFHVNPYYSVGGCCYLGEIGWGHQQQ